MNHFRPPAALIWLLAAALLAGGAAYIGRGGYLAWVVNNDTDMRMRWDELGHFRQGVYPHGRVAQALGKSGVETYTIYPPYAYPVFGLLMFPSRFEAARVVFQILTLAALAVMMWYGWKELGALGPSAGLLGAALAPAFSGNCTAVALGQFSIICVGLLVLQVALLARDKSGWAGPCWALAMIKPQIALPFILFFLLPGRWQGLVSGMSTLALLAAFALWWTNVPPTLLWSQGITTHKLEFAADSLGYGANWWISTLQLDPRWALAFALVAVGLLAAALFVGFRVKFTIESAAALCSVASITLFYHRHYDNILLLFLLLPLIAATLRSKSPHLAVVSLLLALTVYTPPSILARLAKLTPATDWFIFAMPIASLLVLLRAAASSTHQRTSQASGPEK